MVPFVLKVVEIVEIVLALFCQIFCSEFPFFAAFTNFLISLATQIWQSGLGFSSSMEKELVISKQHQQGLETLWPKEV